MTNEAHNETELGQQQVFAALVKAQLTAHAVGKDSRNTQQGYDYASSESVVTECRQALNACGLALLRVHWEFRELENPRLTQTKRGGTMGHLGNVSVTYLLIHESGESIRFDPVAAPVIISPGRAEDKALAAALTYLNGYFNLGLLQLPRGEEVAARDDTQYHRSSGQASAAPKAKFETHRDKVLARLLEAYGVDEHRACAAVGKAEAEDLNQADVTNLLIRGQAARKGEDLAKAFPELGAPPNANGHDHADHAGTAPDLSDDMFGDMAIE